jgi:hypothetical protein
MEQRANKAIISVTPTFLIKKIDHRKVLENYNNGKYTSFKLPEKRTQMNVIKATVEPTYGTSPDAPIYTFRNKNNIVQTVATTNHTSYLAFNSTGQLPMGGICDGCRRLFEHQAIGIPIRIEKIITTLANNEQKVLTVYHCDDLVYHSFECALLGLKRTNRLNWQFRDPLYMDSETMLRNFYAQLYPNAGQLKAANDHRLLKCHGGPLDDAEYDNGHHIFTRSSNVVMVPVKVQYQRL